MFSEQTRTPMISVIIPVYNASATLKFCLEAVLTSDYSSYQCIVVNDCSTDGSENVAGEFPMQVLNVPGGPLGPAYARNRGAEAAIGNILFFVDADVVLPRTAVRQVANVFKTQPDVAAVFGSYDVNPRAEGVISQYRNLLHHFVHQNGALEASTFWAGCGAIRRSVFEKIGGFDEQKFSKPSIEDIELGYRLRAAGCRILLDKTLQATHLKRWDLNSLIRTDITCRALPWSRLILETKALHRDLNLKPGQRASLALVGVACVALLLALMRPQWLALTVAALLGVTILNRKLYAFFYLQRGIVFAAACFPLHLLYYLYSGASYFSVWSKFQLRRAAALRFIRLRESTKPSSIAGIKKDLS
jgi:GT2 family glycosyltransferase